MHRARLLLAAVALAAAAAGASAQLPLRSGWVGVNEVTFGLIDNSHDTLDFGAAGSHFDSRTITEMLLVYVSGGTTCNYNSYAEALWGHWGCHCSYANVGVLLTKGPSNDSPNDRICCGTTGENWYAPSVIGINSGYDPCGDELVMDFPDYTLGVGTELYTYFGEDFRDSTLTDNAGTVTAQAYFRVLDSVAAGAPAPVLTSTSPEGELPTAAAVEVTVDFGELVLGFDASQIAVTNGVLVGAVSPAPDTTPRQTYTFFARPSGDGTFSVSVGAGAWDLSGAAATPSAALTWTARPELRQGWVYLQRAAAGLADGTADELVFADAMYTGRQPTRALLSYVSGTTTCNHDYDTAIWGRWSCTCTLHTELSVMISRDSDDDPADARLCCGAGTRYDPVEDGVIGTVCGDEVDMPLAATTLGASDSLWLVYGEDMLDATLPDNAGEVTSDVYFRFADLNGGAPVAALSSATSGDVAPDTPIVVTVDFGEPVLGFDAAQIGVSGGSVVSGVTPAPDATPRQSYSFTVQSTPGFQGRLEVSVAADGVWDLSGLDGTAAASTLVWNENSFVDSLTVSAGAGSPGSELDVAVSLNEAGTAFCAAYETEAAPDADAVRAAVAGEDGVAAAAQQATSGGSHDALLTLGGLASERTHYVYCTSRDTAGNVDPGVASATRATADVTAPSFTGGLQEGATTGSQVQVTASLDEAGDLFCAVYADGSVGPSGAQLRAGTQVTGFVQASSTAVLQTSHTITFAGVVASETPYEVFCVTGDAAGNQRTATVGVTTLDVTAPLFTVDPHVESSTAAQLVIEATLDGAGEFYCTAVGDNAGGPDAEAVDAAASGDERSASAVSHSVTVAGLAEVTPYDVYCVAEDASGNRSPPFKVDATTADATAPEVDETAALPAVTQANAGPVDLVLTFTDNSLLMNRDTYTAENALVVDDARAKVAYKTHTDDVVTFSVSAQDGTWNQGDSATYTVSLAANKIFDAAGNPVPATTFTAFTVTIDETAPEYVASEEPVVHATTADSVTVRAQANEAGTLRCCAWPASAATRDADAIRGGEDGAQGCSAQAVAAANDDTFVELAGLTVSAGATFFDVWCLLEDDAPAAVLANEAAPFEIANVLLGACPTGVAPQFDVAGSEITAGDDLLLKWRVSGGYESYKFAFVGAEGDDACSMQLPQAAASPLDEDPEWAFAVDGDSCDDDWTFTRNLADTLGACGFAKLEDDPDFTEFRATVEVTTVEDTGAEVLGQAVKQTRTTATEFGVRVPKAVSVTSDDVQAFPGFAGLEADGRSFAVVSTQAYDVDTETFTLRVITAVAWPYVLQLDGTTPVERSSGSNEWTLGASFKGGDCGRQRVRAAVGPDAGPHRRLRGGRRVRPQL